MLESKKLLILLTISMVLSCETTEYFVLEDEDSKPSKVHIYLDCSRSMQGFFSTGIESKAVEILGNINTEFVKQGIDVDFHRFDNGVEVFANSFGEFSEAALNPYFYRCQNNLFSAPLKEITSAIDSLPSDLHIIVTDGVTSTYNPERELADLKNILAQYSKIEDSNISLYQYTFPFNGRYFPQPPYINKTTLRERSILTGSVERNFYAIGFGKQQFISFLDEIFLEKNRALLNQHFNGYLNKDISLSHIDDANLLAKSQVLLTLNLPENLQDRESILSSLNVTDLKGDKIDFSTSQSGKSQFLLTIQSSAKPELDTIKVIVSHRGEFSTKWDSLNYEVTREPLSSTEIDHSKTFQLDLLVDAFSYVYLNSPSFSRKVILKKSERRSFFGPIYFGFPGRQKHRFWVEDGVYGKLTIVFVFLGLIVPIIFYKAGWFDFIENPMSWWYKMLGLAVFLVSTMSVFIIYHGYSKGSNSLPLSWVPVAQHTLLTGLYTAIVFTTISLLIKKANHNLNHIPIS